MRALFSPPVYWMYVCNVCRRFDVVRFGNPFFCSSDGAGATGSGAHEHALRLLDGNSRDLGSKSSRRLTRALLEGRPAEDSGDATYGNNSGDGGGGGGGALAVLSAALEAFRPDLVILSTGLDGRKGHPCGRGDLVADDYEWLTVEVGGWVEVLFGAG